MYIITIDLKLFTNKKFLQKITLSNIYIFLKQSYNCVLNIFFNGYVFEWGNRQIKEIIIFFTAKLLCALHNYILHYFTLRY